MPVRAADRPFSGQEGSRQYLIFRSGRRSDNRIGIYARGGCDLPALFACTPLIQRVLDGTCCLLREGSVADSRSDLLLQTLRPHSPEVIDSLTEHLNVSAEFFEPSVFDHAFVVSGEDGPQPFRKNVIILSIGPDVIRGVYRHREHGVLVDPGGMWLGRPMEEFLQDMSAAQWFRDNFVSVGRISLAQSISNLTQIIQLLRQRTRAHILVLNTLGPEPRGLTHNYQFLKDPLRVRRREFNLALVELSRQLDFSIVDVDRALQRAGIRDQVNWGHTSSRQYLPLAEELFRIMTDLGVFCANPRSSTASPGADWRDTTCRGSRGSRTTRPRGS